MVRLFVVFFFINLAFGNSIEIKDYSNDFHAIELKVDEILQAVKIYSNQQQIDNENAVLSQTHGNNEENYKKLDGYNNNAYHISDNEATISGIQSSQSLSQSRTTSIAATADNQQKFAEETGREKHQGNYKGKEFNLGFNINEKDAEYANYDANNQNKNKIKSLGNKKLYGDGNIGYDAVEYSKYGNDDTNEMERENSGFGNRFYGSKEGKHDYTGFGNELEDDGYYDAGYGKGTTAEIGLERIGSEAVSTGRKKTVEANGVNNEANYVGDYMTEDNYQKMSNKQNYDIAFNQVGANMDNANANNNVVAAKDQVTWSMSEKTGKKDIVGNAGLYYEKEKDYAGKGKRHGQKGNQYDAWQNEHVEYNGNYGIAGNNGYRFFF